MRQHCGVAAALGLVLCLLADGPAGAQEILRNPSLDRTAATEIVPGFFLPKPIDWVNEGSRTLTGPYEDEMSSEPWAGPAPTPVTTGGTLNGAHPAGCGGDDCAVFFKAFSGNVANGPATGHLYQDNPATPGTLYRLTGWAGAEANLLSGAELALDFLNAGGGVISSSELDLLAAGLLTPNGQPFNYKQYTIDATAPIGATTVRARASMVGGLGNPAGGGQALVFDDFSLRAVPEPASVTVLMAAALGLLRRKRSV